MERMTTVDIQRVSLNIMDEIHKFCTEHQLQYSLAYGSLIGAVRHHGFIPWDDDMDIIMPRKDYDDFCRLWTDNDKYKLFCPQKNNALSGIARVCEMQETFVQTKMPLFSENTGVWVDIFPLDFVKDDADFNRRMEIAIDLHHVLLRRRSALMSIRKQTSLVEVVKILAKRILRHQDEWQLVCQIDANAREEQQDFGWVANFSLPIYKQKDYHQSDIFEHSVEMSFDGRVYKASSNYDSYLRNIYGDYMQLPPEDKRTNHSFHKYYWK